MAIAIGALVFPCLWWLPSLSAHLICLNWIYNPSLSSSFALSGQRHRHLVLHRIITLCPSQSLPQSDSQCSQQRCQVKFTFARKEKNRLHPNLSPAMNVEVNELIGNWQLNRRWLAFDLAPPAATTTVKKVPSLTDCLSLFQCFHSSPLCHCECNQKIEQSVKQLARCASLSLSLSLSLSRSLSLSLSLSLCLPWRPCH